MTDILQRAFDKAAQLSADEQDAVGNWLLAELASEQRWDKLFRSSPKLLEKLADEAMAEDDAGLTLPIDPGS